MSLVAKTELLNADPVFDRNVYLKRYEQSSETLAKIREHTRTNKSKKAIYDREYRRRRKENIHYTPKERKSRSAKIRIRQHKRELMDKYGGCCVGCGISETAVLTIDHINDDGAKERRTKRLTGYNFYHALLKIPRRSDLQVLCCNCQNRKRFYGSKMSEWPDIVNEEANLDIRGRCNTFNLKEFSKQCLNLNNASLNAIVKS